MSATVVATQVIAPPQSQPTPAHVAASTAPAAEKVPFTLSDLRAAIPPQCLVKDTWRSIGYMLRDFAFIAIMYAIYPYINAHDGAYNPFGLTKFLWWNVTGFLGWCLFVVGHDCGHRTFSDSVGLCDLFGHICHAPLLVPFHGWRISHRKHHEHHNHVEDDHTWRPTSKTLFDNSTGLGKLMRFSHLLLVIFPAYLLTDSPLTSGNHFNPWSRLFAPEERLGAFLSAAAVASWLTFLFVTFPVRLLLDAYFAPYIFFVVWLDLVTYLHHTDVGVNYYRGSAWSFLKGGLSTIDRSYGWIVDHLHHDIGTHMVHHLFFTRVPHYSLVEATEALKPILGQHYKFDDTPVLQAYLRAKNNCHFVDDQGEVLQYHAEGESVADNNKKAQ